MINDFPKQSKHEPIEHDRVAEVGYVFLLYIAIAAAALFLAREILLP